MYRWVWNLILIFTIDSVSLIVLFRFFYLICVSKLYFSGNLSILFMFSNVLGLKLFKYTHYFSACITYSYVISDINYCCMPVFLLLFFCSSLLFFIPFLLHLLNRSQSLQLRLAFQSFAVSSILLSISLISVLMLFLVLCFLLFS